MRGLRALIIAGIAAAVTGVCLLIVCAISPDIVVAPGDTVVGDADLTQDSHVYSINTDGSGFTRLDDVVRRANTSVGGFTYKNIADDGSKAVLITYPTYHSSGPYSPHDITYLVDFADSSFTTVEDGRENTQYEFSPDFSKIACFDRTNYSLYMMNGDGSGKTQIAYDHEDEDKYMEFSWAPDSSKLIYVPYRIIDSTSDYVQEGNINLLDAASNNHTKLADYTMTGHDSMSLQWSPDSRIFYYLKSDDLYSINTDVGTVKKLADDIFNRSYYLSPDGSRLLYTTDDKSTYVMNADGSNKVALLDNTVQLSWAPDSSKIAYLVRIGEGYTADLYVIDADGSDRTRLTGYDESGVTYFEWSPDSEKIYYLRVGVSDTEYMSDIYVTSTDRTYFAKLTDYWDDAEYDINHAFDLSQDGTKLAYVLVENLTYGESFSFTDMPSRKMSMYVMNTDGTETQKVMDCSSLSSLEPVWSPDGSKLLVIADKQIEEPEE